MFYLSNIGMNEHLCLQVCKTHFSILMTCKMSINPHNVSNRNNDIYIWYLI